MGKVKARCAVLVRRVEEEVTEELEEVAVPCLCPLAVTCELRPLVDKAQLDQQPALSCHLPKQASVVRFFAQLSVEQVCVATVSCDQHQHTRAETQFPESDGERLWRAVR